MFIKKPFKAKNHPLEIELQVISVTLILGNEGILYLYHIVNAVNIDLIRMNSFTVISF